MRININIEKRGVFAILAGLLLIAGVIGVYADHISPTINPSHSIDDIPDIPKCTLNKALTHDSLGVRCISPGLILLYDNPIVLSNDGKGASGTITAGVGISANAKAVLLHGVLNDANNIANRNISFKYPSQTNWKYLISPGDPYYQNDNSAWVPLDGQTKQLMWSISKASAAQNYLLEIQGEME